VPNLSILRRDSVVLVVLYNAVLDWNYGEEEKESKLKETTFFFPVQKPDIPTIIFDN